MPSPIGPHRLPFEAEDGSYQPVDCASATTIFSMGILLGAIGGWIVAGAVTRWYPTPLEGEPIGSSDYTWGLLAGASLGAVVGLLHYLSQELAWSRTSLAAAMHAAFPGAVLGWLLSGGVDAPVLFLPIAGAVVGALTALGIRRVLA